MNEQTQGIKLQIDHPAVDDLQAGYRAESVEAHVLSLIHRWPYEQLALQAKGKDVLELGCNKGFGTVIYAGNAHSVKAADTSVEAIEEARKLNSCENVDYIRLDSWTLPFEDNSFDITVLFQVVEHIALDRLEIFLQEIKRVTRDNGVVILTTPNRNIRLLPLQKPWNPFHTKEYSARELYALLSRYFPEVRIQGLFGTEAINRIERKRVEQKISKVYFRKPVKKHLIAPIAGWIFGSAKTDRERPRKQREKDGADSSRSQATDTTAARPEDYPYTLADLELRDTGLHRALDLRATVQRVK